MYSYIMCICVHVYMNCVHIWEEIGVLHLCVSMSVCICRYKSRYVYVYTYVCVCIYVCVYLEMAKRVIEETCRISGN